VSDAWLAASGLPTGVQAGTVLRHAPGLSKAPHDRCNLGDRCGDDPAAVAANRAGLRGWLNLPGEPCWLRQVHGVKVYRASGPSDGLAREPPQADAAVSDVPGVVLAVLSADCLPVVLASDDGTIAVAHAGWRGLAAGVLEATVAAIAGDPTRLSAWLGPAIGAGSFEVGPEVRAAFVDADPASAAAFVSAAGDRSMADLYALARRRLGLLGLTRISGGGLDTCADASRFHSYRRDGQRSGRMATLVWHAGGSARS
jgi:hypothetical protein